MRLASQPFSKRHANAARDEMAAIYADLDTLRVAAGVRSPSAVSLSRTLVAS